MAKIDYEINSNCDPRLPFTLHKVPLRANGDTANIYINWHSDLEIVYCTGGEGEVMCGSKFIKMKKGDIAVINPNIFHDIITGSSFDFYVLLIGTTFFDENSIDIEKFFFEDYIRDPDTEDAFLALAEAFAKGEDPMRPNLLSPSGSTTYRNVADTAIPFIRHTVLGLILKLYTSHIAENGLSISAFSQSSERIKEVVSYIKLHFTERLTLEKIAKVSNMSKSYLVHEFKRFTRQTVIEYINTLRCINAQSLIRNGVNVSDAAFSSGFENLSYFSRTYKRLMSCLPSEEKVSKK